jgi:hypothetical protein
MTAPRLLLAAGAVAAAYVAADRSWETPAYLPPPPAGEVAADRAAAVRRAFAGPPDRTADPAARRLLDAIGSAAGRRDGLAVLDRFDTRRLFARIRAADVPGAAGLSADPGDSVGDLDGVLLRGVRGGWLARGWDRTDLRGIDADGPGRWVAFARHSRGPDATPARWWLTGGPAGWTAADVEDVRVGVRLSELLAGLATTQVDEAAAKKLDAGLTALGAAATALADRDPVTAGKRLEPARSAPFPPAHRLIWCLTEAAVALGLNDAEAALTWAAEADRVRPGTPAADTVRAVALFRLGRWAECEAAARRAVAAVGPDPRASLVLGLALAELGRPADAVAELQAAAAEFPDADPLREAVARLTLGGN